MRDPAGGDVHVTRVRAWTGSAASRHTGTIRIRNGRIVALDAGVAVPSGGSVIDAGGLWAVPGFVDAHVHLLLGGLRAGRPDLSRVTTRAAFEDAVGRAHAELPTGRWLIAHGWSEDRIDGRVLPDRTWLRAAGDRPVVCWRSDLHAAVVNDAVLHHIRRTGGDVQGGPASGEFVRDPDGVPTGLLLETAAWHVLQPRIPPPSVAEKRGALRAALGQLLARGVTTVGAMEYEADLRQVILPSRSHGAMQPRVRVTLLDRTWPFDPGPACAHAGDRADDPDLRIIGCKAFVDGTMGSRTARLRAPYADRPGDRGMLVELARDGHLEAWIRLVAEAGLQPSMHAIGDEAVGLALDAIDALGPALESRCRPRIEHAQQIDPADFHRFRGRIASVQPAHAIDDAPGLVERVGADRLPGSFAWQSLLDHGAILAFGSDWPVVDCDPMLALRTAIVGPEAGRDSGERLSSVDAMMAHTAGAAHALCDAGVGAIAPGRHADLVLLDRDPRTADWAAAPPRVIATMVGGRIAWSAPGFEPA